MVAANLKGDPMNDHLHERPARNRVSILALAAASLLGAAILAVPTSASAFHSFGGGHANRAFAAHGFAGRVFANHGGRYGFVHPERAPSALMPPAPPDPCDYL
jgi:hypothetical protein